MLGKNDRLVVIGASHGGVQLASSVRELGFEGQIILLGREKVMPYHRPPLSKAYLKADDAKPQLLKGESFYDDHNIALKLGAWAQSIDCHAQKIHLREGTIEPYDHLVLATGLRPRQLKLDQVDVNQCLNVHALRNVKDAQNLRNHGHNAKNIVIIGAGFIGLEVAASLKSSSNSVHIIEAAPRIMGRAVAPEISNHVQARYAQLGINIQTDCTINQLVTQDNHVTALEVEGEKLECDLLLVAIGGEPNIELAKSASLDLDNGIRVDASLRTSDAHISAIGDVANYRNWQVGEHIRVESVQNAVDQAKCLAGHLLGKPQEYEDLAWFWSDQADMKLQMAGLSHRSEHRVVRKYPQDNKLSVFHYDAGGRFIALDSINAPADHMMARRFIKAGAEVDQEKAANPEISLKSMME